MSKNLLFPSLRCKMGDWIYYVTFMTFNDVKLWIKPTKEVHSSRGLSQWIQRQLEDDHADAIASYLESQPERMFNALFVGIYEGEPEWSELKITSNKMMQSEITTGQLDSLTRSVGLLHLSGDEKLFAIDGQHRVAGIKKVIEGNDKLKSEEVTVILVGHQTDTDGILRTRRLFTTLNKTAKKVSKKDIIALDEDNGSAIITRKLVNDFSLFEDERFIAYNPSANLKPNDEYGITSIVKLYDLVSILSSTTKATTAGKFNSSRPTEDILNLVYDYCCKYWELLSKEISEYREVLIKKTKKAEEYRHPDCNHLLFRPIGQHAFAEAVAHMVCKLDIDLSDAIKILSTEDLWIHKSNWHHILWDPLNKKMITKGSTIAKIHLLFNVDCVDKLPAKQLSKYNGFLKSRG